MFSKKPSKLIRLAILLPLIALGMIGGGWLALTKDDRPYEYTLLILLALWVVGMLGFLYSQKKG